MAKRKDKNRKRNKKPMLTLTAVHADLQMLAQVCQQNFMQMSQNDKVLVDMATTNGIHINAMMKALVDNEIELQPYIDAEIEKRNKELKEIQERTEALKGQVQEAVEKASIVQPAEHQEGDYEPPDDAAVAVSPRPEDETLIYNGPYDPSDHTGMEEVNVVREES